MKIVAKACVSLLALVACALVLVEAFHFVKYRHLAPLGLHADFTMRHADLGIEGITKTYGVKLTNYGLRPAAVTDCEYVGDSLARGTNDA
jgi:hypothetical protein